MLLTHILKHQSYSVDLAGPAMAVVLVVQELFNPNSALTSRMISKSKKQIGLPMK
jgi:hypothetical protein